MAQNVILQHCDLERSRSSAKINKFSIIPLPPAHKFLRNRFLTASFSVMVFQLLTEMWPGEERKNMTETL